MAHYKQLLKKKSLMNIAIYTKKSERTKVIKSVLQKKFAMKKMQSFFNVLSIATKKSKEN